ncbi:MAG: D-mannonate epimerase, partial [Planctomycetota bacterium]
AHLEHGSTENRFRVEYCPGGLRADETNSVGYSYGDWKTAMDEYGLAGLQDGWHTSRSGEPFYFIRNPGLGLWMHRGHPHAF